MKTRLHALTLLAGLALFAGGCGNSAQQKAYEKTAAAEPAATAENAPAIIADYQRVIALDPGSDWARKARDRIEAVEAGVKAKELHKSVFQEHGVD